MSNHNESATAQTLALDSRDEALNSALESSGSAEGSRKSTSSAVEIKPDMKPNVFDYSDYRLFLSDFLVYKKSKNTSYSASMFIQRAGIASNSRGYLKLVIENKRNLSPSTVATFAFALDLTEDESLYFENLVFFNQSKSNKEKKYYFEKLSKFNNKNKSKQFEVIESEYRFFNHWYVAAVLQLTYLKDFKEDASWIVKRLKNKILRTEATQSIKDLINLKFLTRNEQGQLIANQELFKIPALNFSSFIQNYHRGMIQRSLQSLDEDSHTQRSTSGITISCNQAQYQKIKEKIDEFRDFLNQEFGTSEGGELDAVMQINFQLFYLTDVNERKKYES
jgi:uncharacterized protein (TIGR02147 family)